MNKRGLGDGRRAPAASGAPSSRPTLVALLAVAALAPSCAGGEREASSTTRTIPAAKEAARTHAAAPVRLQRPPRAGTVAVEPGPFTDRVSFSGLTLRRGTRPSVTGRIRNRVDVSELLLLELRVNFYDRRGRVIGSGKRVFLDQEEFGTHPLRFAVRARRPAAAAVAAQLSVPQLVNE